METTHGPAGDLAPLDPELAEVDRRLEALLDESIALDSPRFLLSMERPFAPWEVRNAGNFRLAAMTVGSLVGGSLSVGLLPLWRLGPGTAVVVWTDLLAAALVRPVEVLAGSFPLLVRAAASVRSEDGLLPVPVLLLGTLGVGAATWLLWRSRPERATESAPRS